LPAFLNRFICTFAGTARKKGVLQNQSAALLQKRPAGRRLFPARAPAISG
jgi:hypothetical protein